MSLDETNSFFPAATRKSALAALHNFAPRMGMAYESQRNFDFGPRGHTAVSQLSPFIRRRLLLEEEVIAEALQEHGAEGAAKFVEEVIWRGYFKGWMERRPQVWDSYRAGLDQDFNALDRDRRLRAAVARAETGDTGIDCFDAWARELVETGYLHNHARMWFASIWIFTLELPWRVGADFFYRHLLDGDPASNTLGWRWAAGLHTRGKPYFAQAWNIAKFTDHRFTPRESDLAEGVEGLEAEEPEGLPSVCSLRVPRAPETERPTALLITEDDCRPETFDLTGLDLRGAATLAGSHLRSPRPVAPCVIAFEAEALNDAARRCGHEVTALKAGASDDLVRWAQEIGACQIVTPYVPTGPMRDWLKEAQPSLDAAGIVFAELRRDWDAAIWPHATAGFFKVKKKIPKILHQSDLL